MEAVITVHLTECFARRTPDPGTKIFMASSGEVGMRVVFSAPQLRKRGICLRSPGKSVTQGTESRSPDALHTITKAQNSRKGCPNHVCQQEEGK